MKRSTLSVLLLALALGACESDSTSAESEASAKPDPVGASTDTLRYSIAPGFAWRTLLIDWYHVSFGSPLAVRTLANRPAAQAIILGGQKGSVALPASVDAQFEFYAKLGQYASDEAQGRFKQNFLDSIPIYENRHRWAMAPLVLARTDEYARMTLGQLGAGANPTDSVALGSGYVMLWVRDSIVAEQDVQLAGRKLTGRFGAGWHLLVYRDSGRTLTACPLSDTVRFRSDAPNPNLV